MIRLFALLALVFCNFVNAQVSKRIVIKAHGHTALVTDLAVHPNEKQFITCSYDKSIKLWNAETKSLEDEFLGEIGSNLLGTYQKVAISPSGKIVAGGAIVYESEGISGIRLAGIRLFDFYTRKMLRLIRVGSGNIKALSFLSDNEIVVATDENLFIYKTDSGIVSDSLKVSAEISKAVIASGKIIIGISEDGLYEWKRGLNQLKKVYTQTEPLYALASDKNGSVAMAYGEKKLAVLNKDLLVVATTQLEFYSSNLAFNDNGTQLLSGTLEQQGSSILYNVEANKLRKVGEYKKQTGLVGGVGLVKDMAVTAGGNDHRVVIWKPTGNENIVNTLAILTSKSLPVMAASMYSSLLTFGMAKSYHNSTFPHQLMFSIERREINQLVPMGSIVYMMPKPVLEREEYKLQLNQQPGKTMMVELLRNDKLLNTMPFENAYALTFLPSGHIAIGGKGGRIMVFNIYGIEVANLNGHTDYITSLTIDGSNENLVSSSLDGTIRLWDLKKLVYDDAYLSSVKDQFSENEGLQKFVTDHKLDSVFNSATTEAWLQLIESLFRNGQSTLGDKLYNMLYAIRQTLINDVEPAMSVFIARDESWVIWNNDGYYTSSPEAGKNIGFHINQGAEKEAKFYSFEQFDLHYNRPDIINKFFNPYDTAITDAYYNAYLRRLKHAGVSNSTAVSDALAPQLNLMNPSGVSSQDIVALNYTAEDADKLSRVHVYVNNNAVYGVSGRSVENLSLKKISSTTNQDILKPIILSYGRNKVDMAVTNQKGIESYKGSFIMQYDPPQKTKPDLYVITIGVSKYKNPEFNLTYPSKDAGDMAALLSSKKKDQYGNIQVISLTDEMVTKQAIMELKAKLMQTSVNDEVILFIAGHGLLDKNYTYYFATYDINFESPAGSGISFEDIENVLDGIPARKKLLLMDTCHSGEVDNNDDLDISALVQSGVVNDENKSYVKSEGTRGVSLKKKATKPVGLSNSYNLLRQLFADLRKSSGTIVIAASSGEGYALESPKWQNGVFTYAVLNGLSSMEADADKDGKIRVSELRNYVVGKVAYLTDNKQQPTVRKDNIENDYVIW